MRKPLLATLAVGALLLTACGGDDDAATTPSAPGTTGAAAPDLELISDGTLTVCSEVPYAPFEIEDSGKPSGYGGFDIDVMQAIADNLSLELSVQDVGFDALTSGAVFTSGQCDVGASAITITDERKANLDFSDSYYDSKQSLLVASDSGITSIDDLADKNVGVQQGTTGETYANDNVPEGTTVTSFQGDQDMWAALQAENIDAILQDLPVNLVHSQADDGFDIAETYDTDEAYGFALGKGLNPALLSAINEQLQVMKSDGSYDTLYDSYFSTS